MPITRTPIIDDDGTGTSGTVIDNAWKQELYDQIDASGGPGVQVIIREDVGPVNDWTVGMTRDAFIVWMGAGPAAVTGINQGVAGRTVTIYNNGASILTLTHFSGASLAANRLFNIAISAPTPLAPGGSARYVHSGGGWVLLDHEQGADITVPYNAANFTSSAGTWVVAAGDVAVQAYRLSGKSLSVTIGIAGADITGAPTTLYAAGWGGFTMAAYAGMQFVGVSSQASAAGWGAVLAVFGATFVAFNRTDFAAFPATTGGNYVSFQGRVTVT